MTQLVEVVSTVLTVASAIVILVIAIAPAFIDADTRRRACGC